MGNLLPKREEAWDLLCEFTLGDSLRKHAQGLQRLDFTVGGHNVTDYTPNCK